MKKWFFIVLFCFSSMMLQAEEGSVVLIHGFLPTYKSMTPIKKCLENLGLDLYLWGYASRSDTVQENAQTLVCLLNKIAACSPDKPIHFVAHSVGGWVLRAALNHPECPSEAKVGRAALIGTPNRGSSLAHSSKEIFPCPLILGCETGRELRNYTECDIINLGNFPEEMQMLVIAGCRGSLKYWRDEPNDGFILVEETELNTPYYFETFNASHQGLLKNQAVRSLVCSFICHGFPEEEETEE